MKSSREAVLVLLVVAALSVAVVSPAAAASGASEVRAPGAPALACAAGACQIVGNAPGVLRLLQLSANLALAQAPFETTADGGTQATLDAQKDITLALPIGELTLANAKLQVEVGKDGQIRRLNGSADMPFPTFGLLDDTHVVQPARADVGLDLGKNLPDVGAALQPERPYLFFNANSFLSVAGRTAGSPNEFALTFTPGQRLTLVVDTVDPVAYLNGQVTLSVIDQIALLGGLLENTPLGPYVPDTLPLRERTQFGLAGKFSKDLSASRLKLRGGYMLDASFLPAQLGIDAQLVDVLGQLTLSRDGVLVDGVLKSSIEPDKVFDGSVEVQAFVPFGQASQPSYASVDGNVRVPAGRLDVGGGARASEGKYELNGQLSTPFRDAALKGKVAGRQPDIAGTVGPAMGQAAGAVGSVAGKAAGAVGSAANHVAVFVGPLAGRAAAAVGGYTRFSLNAAESAIHAGRAKLSGDSGSATAAAPEM